MSCSRMRKLHRRKAAIVARTAQTLFIFVLSAIAYTVAYSEVRAQASPKPEDASGQVAFNNSCRTCHTLNEGDNRLGPNLHSVIGRKAGSLQDYNYSNAMKQAGFTWDQEKLDQFIANPDQVVPGHNMKPFGGLSSNEDRKKIIAFLSQRN
jgi:cytochrome c